MYYTCSQRKFKSRSGSFDFTELTAGSLGLEETQLMMKMANNPCEWEYYDLVKEALEGEFKNKGYCVDFEVTGHPKGKRIPERFLLKNATLREHIKEVLPTPDVMGLVWRSPGDSKKLVVAEFKPSPKFEDIFQTKGYDELFSADYSLLVGAKSISESSQRTMDFIRTNPQLLKTKEGKGKIYIMFVHKTTEGILTLARLGSEVDLPDLCADLAF